MRKFFKLEGLLVLSLAGLAGLTAAGCQVDPAASEADAGTGGSGGNGGGGAQTDAGSGGAVVPGGDCASLGPINCVLRADCVADGDACRDAADADCSLLRADQCPARVDCVTQLDVFGDFADCRGVADAPCSLLDESRCGGRDDCAWDGTHCGLPAVACEDRVTADDCTAAACHWYGEACHTDAEPARCDQPDEGTCLNAGCEWGDNGCHEPVVVMTCPELAQAACLARAECVWQGDHCDRDPVSIPCAELDLNACAVRNDCAIDPVSATCVIRPVGACEQLDQPSCAARPDCVAEYNAPPGCDCGGAAGGAAGDAAAPAPACPPDDPNCNPACDCVGAFVACHNPVALDCTAVASDVCDQTPGCHTEVGCAPCPPGVACPDICQQILTCVNNDPGAACAIMVDANSCFSNPACDWTPIPGCAGGGEVPPPCDCPPDDPNCACAGIAVPVQDACFACTPRAVVGPCEALPADICAVTPGCHLEAPPCDCGWDAAGRPIACECPSVCVTDIFPCSYFDAASCQSDPMCEWFDNGGGPVPVPPPVPGDCGCAPGDANCACGGGGAAVAPAGFCQVRVVEPCAVTPVDQCDATPGCGVIELLPPCAPCPDGVDCPACDPVPVCVPLNQICGGLDEAACTADLRCLPQTIQVCQGGGGACPPGVDCPPPEPPVCQDQFFCSEAANACVRLDEMACAAQPGCGALWNADGTFSTCWPLNQCDGLDQAQCGAVPGCLGQLIPGPCGCVVDPNGREICDCAPDAFLCTPDNGGAVPPPPPPPVDPGQACVADADCPAGAFCAQGACVFPL